MIDDKTMKFQPGDNATIVIQGKVVSCSVGIDLDGRVRKQVRLRYGTSTQPRFLIADENEMLPPLVSRPARAISVTHRPATEEEKARLADEKGAVTELWNIPLDPKATTAHFADEADLVPEVGCEKCMWVGTVKQLKDIRDISKRIKPGEIMPVGECPACGALAHFYKPEVDNNVPMSRADLLAM